jgi:hypothetical protein
MPSPPGAYSSGAAADNTRFCPFERDGGGVICYGYCDSVTPH